MSTGYANGRRIDSPTVNSFVVGSAADSPKARKSAKKAEPAPERVTEPEDVGMAAAAAKVAAAVKKTPKG